MKNLKMQFYYFATNILVKLQNSRMMSIYFFLTHWKEQRIIAKVAKRITPDLPVTQDELNLNTRLSSYRKPWKNSEIQEFYNK